MSNKVFTVEAAKAECAVMRGYRLFAIGVIIAMNEAPRFFGSL